ncbi:MAG: hypothetical protein KAI14_06090 [Dehalococcoidales bacterium]|nr:hypothetical protein [Dehalococcoidales bacterium]
MINNFRRNITQLIIVHGFQYVTTNGMTSTSIPPENLYRLIIGECSASTSPGRLWLPPSLTCPPPKKEAQQETGDTPSSEIRPGAIGEHDQSDSVGEQGKGDREAARDYNE